MQGFNVHRHNRNPLEKIFHDKFISEFVNPVYSPNILDKIIFGTNSSNNPSDYLTEREINIAITTIQWLGSPVGQGFLESCGFKLQLDN